MSDCGICCSGFNNSSLKPIECLYCREKVCTSCCKKWILDKIELSCMFCKKAWNTDFLYSNFTKSFIENEYKNHKKNILFQNEKNLLPMTMVEVEKLNSVDKYKQEIKEIDKLMKSLRLKKTNLSKIIDRTLHPGRYNTNQGTGAQKVEEEEKTKKEFIRPCPHENCRGFLSTQLKCGLCEKWGCSDCWKPLQVKNDPAHTCNKDDVESVKLIKESCRPCPNCGTSIHKISGCDQMYCVKCHTAFSWETGQVETGKIHNPHYYEYARQNNIDIRDPGDLGCNNIDTYYVRQIARKFDKSIRIGKNSINLFERINIIYTNLLQMFNHIQAVSLRQYRTDVARNNQDLRIRYLRNEISEKQWKMLLYKREKKHNYKFNMYNLLDTFRMVIENTFIETRAYVTSVQDYIDNEVGINEILLKLYQYIDYFNENSIKFCKQYNYKKYVVARMWRKIDENPPRDYPYDISFDYISLNTILNTAMNKENLELFNIKNYKQYVPQVIFDSDSENELVFDKDNNEVVFDSDSENEVIFDESDEKELSVDFESDSDN